MFKNIVVGLKEGLQHEPLLDLATGVAAAEAEIHLASFIRVGTYEDEPVRLERMERELEQHSASLRSGGYQVTYDVSLIAVAAAAELLRLANQRNADLLVIGLAKRTRVGKALMGSDAQRVILSSGCAVLVTHLYG